MAKLSKLMVSKEGQNYSLDSKHNTVEQAMPE
jgi:hypothetical protein